MTGDRTTKRLRESLASAVEPLVEQETRAAGPHPSLDELIRYHGGALDEAAAELVQRHLVTCAECLETLLDLDGFVGTGTEQRSGDSAPSAEPPARNPGAVRPSRPALLAVAASLLLAVVGLAVWGSLERRNAGDLRREVARLSAPRPDVPIVDLLPDSVLRSETEGSPGPTLAPGDGPVTFVLTLPEAAGLSRFEAELVDPAGRVTWSGPIARSRYGTFTLGLARGSLAPGENRVRLYGRDDGERRLLEVYTFRVEPGEEDG